MKYRWVYLRILKDRWNWWFYINQKNITDNILSRQRAENLIAKEIYKSFTKTVHRRLSLKIDAFIFHPWTEKSRKTISLCSNPSGSSDPEGFAPPLFYHCFVFFIQGRAISCPFRAIRSDLLGFSWLWLFMNGVEVRFFSATSLIQELTSSNSCFGNKNSL